MLADQPLDELGVGFVEAVGDAEVARVLHAELRVVAAAPLGDVVEERRDVDQPGLLEAGGEARHERVFVGVLGDHQAAHVAQHLHDVLIDGVHMKQVVLHLADDAPPGGQVEAQDAVLVHPPHLLHHAALLLQEPQEQRPVGGVAAEIGVDQFAAMPQGPQGAGGHALEFGALLQEQEAFEHRARVALEDALVAHVEQFAHALEAFVDVDRHRVPVGEERDPEVEH